MSNYNTNPNLLADDRKRIGRTRKALAPEVDATISMRLRSRRGSLTSRQTSTASTTSPTITRQSSVESLLDGRISSNLGNGTEANSSLANGYTAYGTDQSLEEEDSDNAAEEESTESSPESADEIISGEESNSDDDDQDQERRNWKEECNNSKRQLEEIRAEYNIIKERMFNSKEFDLEKEREDIEIGLHPYLQRLGEKDTDRQRREINAERRRNSREVSIEKAFEARQKQAIDQYMAGRRALRKSMFEEQQSKKHRLDIEYSKSILKSKEPSSPVMDLMIKQMENDSRPQANLAESRDRGTFKMQSKIITFNLKPETNEKELEEDLRLFRQYKRTFKIEASVSQNPTLTPNINPMTTPTPVTTLISTISSQSTYQTQREPMQREHNPRSENQCASTGGNSIVKAWLAEDDNDSDKEYHIFTNQYRNASNRNTHMLRMMMQPQIPTMMEAVLANNSR